MAMQASSGTGSGRRTTPRSVSADDRRIAQQNPTSAGSAYHLPRTTTPQPVRPTPNTSRVATTAPPLSVGQRVAVPVGWMGQQSGGSIPKQSNFNDPNSWRYNGFQDRQGAAYNFRSGGPIGANVGVANMSDPRLTIGAGVGQVAQGDWGMNAAAQAQVELIKAWGAENMAAAAESEIARGMGRSGAYDAAVAREMDRSRMEATAQMMEAAAEQGRLNQQVALQNGQTALEAAMANQGIFGEAALQDARLALDREIANQQALLEADQMRSAYRQWQDEFARDTAFGNAQNRLAYLNFGADQFNANRDYGLARTQADRGYQMDRLGFNEAVRNADADRAMQAWAQQGDWGQQAAGRDLDWRQTQAGLADSRAAREQDAYFKMLEAQGGGGGRAPMSTNDAIKYLESLWMRDAPTEGIAPGTPGYRTPQQQALFAQQLRQLTGY